MAKEDDVVDTHSFATRVAAKEDAVDDTHSFATRVAAKEDDVDVDTNSFATRVVANVIADAVAQASIDAVDKTCPIPSDRETIERLANIPSYGAEKVTRDTVGMSKSIQAENKPMSQFAEKSPFQADSTIIEAAVGTAVEVKPVTTAKATNEADAVKTRNAEEERIGSVESEGAGDIEDAVTDIEANRDADDEDDIMGDRSRSDRGANDNDNDNDDDDDNADDKSRQYFFQWGTCTRAKNKRYAVFFCLIVLLIMNERFFFFDHLF